MQGEYGQPDIYWIPTPPCLVKNRQTGSTVGRVCQCLPLGGLGLYILKSVIVFSLVKQLFLDVDSLASYHPISNLPFLGKVTE